MLENHNLFLIHDNQPVTFEEFKNIVKKQMAYIADINPNRVILSGDNTFVFLINLFSCIYLNIPVVLISDKTKLKYTEGVFIDSIVSTGTLKDFETDINHKYVIEFMTSGTTGTPKIIKKTLKNLLLEAEEIVKTFDLSSITEFITTTTMTHLFGFTFCFMVPTIAKKPINTKRLSYPEEITQQGSAFISTPSFLSKLFKYDIMPKTLPNYIFSAGAKLENNVFEYLEKHTNIVEIYGSTETGIIAHREKSYENLKIFDNVKINNNNIISPFIYEKELIMNDDILIKNSKIVDIKRNDRIVKIQEERVSLEEVETCIKKLDLTSDCSCFQLNDKIAAVVVLSNSGIDKFLNFGKIDFVKHLKKELKNKINKIPQKWKFVDRIPKNTLGKNDYEYMKSLFSTNLSMPLVINRELDKINLVFHRDSNFFKGHFDKYPIVPGVVQLYYAVFFINEMYGININAGQLKKIKFSNIITPDKKIELELLDKGTYILYKYQNNDTVYSSGQLPKENIFEDIL